MHVQQHITVQRDIAAFSSVLARFIERSHPIGMAVLQQGQFVFPVELSPDAYLMRKPLAHCQVQSERFPVRKHMRKIISIRILQRHVESHLHIPVLPEPIRHHNILPRAAIHLFECLRFS